MELFLVMIIFIEFAAILISIKLMKVLMQKVNDFRTLAKKNLKIYLMLNKWLHIKRENKQISDYLKDNNYLSVIIYGVNNVGEQVIEELSNSSVEIVCGIDQNADNIHVDLKVIKPTENIPEADVIIVTAVSYFMQIDDFLQDKVSCPIISLEDIIYSM